MAWVRLIWGLLPGLIEAIAIWFAQRQRLQADDALRRDGALEEEAKHQALLEEVRRAQSDVPRAHPDDLDRRLRDGSF